MEKLKKSAVAKVVAAILLSVSILATVVSGVVVSMAFSYGTTRRVQGEAIYDEFMSRMVDDSASRARDYYQAYLQGEAEGQENHTVWYYKDYFAEENSNFFFKIVPEDTKKYPTLENYESKDYQFHEVLSQQTQLLEGSTSFSYKLSLPDIIKFWKENYVPDEYSYDDRAAYEEDADVFSSELQFPSTIQDMYWDWSTISFDDLGISYDDDSSNPYIYLVNTDFVYYLSNDEGYTKALESAIKKLGDGDIQYMDISYRNDGTVTQELEISTPVSYTMYAYVKSNMTARDLYANSIVLRYCKPIVNMAPYVLAISLIMILVMGGFLIAASGHRKGQETITCNAFDRIPYDVFLGAAIVLVVNVINLYLYYSYSTRDEIFLASICTAVVAFLIPPFLMTTSTRMKADGWAMFANTLIWRLCKLLVRVVKWAFGKLRDLFRFLGRHFNLYWKWIGGLAGIALLRFILVAASGSAGLAIVLDLVCAALLAVFLIRVIVQMYRLKDGAKKIADGETDYKIDTTHMLPEFAAHGETLNCIQDSVRVAVAERMKSERMKTELITNVSHDIKTPLTSIINYVDILSKEGDLSDKEAEYLGVLQRQSARLKKLIEDLIEASKASTGNLEVHMEPTDVEMLLEQALGEFEERLAACKLQPVVTNYLTKKYGAQADCHVMADGRHLWRVFDNLIGNIIKYAQPNSRVYIDIDEAEPGEITVTFKNISKEPLNISGDELKERFVRGDRSRNTEGNGLGLSIAQSLMELQNGKVEIMIDGDLFKVVLLLKTGNCKN